MSFLGPPESGSVSGGKAGIEKVLKSLNSRADEGDGLRIIRGTPKSQTTKFK